MFEAMLVLLAFLIVFGIAMRFLKNVRKRDGQFVAVGGQDLPDTESLERFILKRNKAGILKRNKAGILSFHPLVILVFIASFLVIFPFDKLAHKTPSNPKLVQYWKQIGGLDGFNKMTAAQKYEVNKKIESLLSDKI